MTFRERLLLSAAAMLVVGGGSAWADGARFSFGYAPGYVHERPRPRVVRSGSYRHAYTSCHRYVSGPRYHTSYVRTYRAPTVCRSRADVRYSAPRTGTVVVPAHTGVYYSSPSVYAGFEYGRVPDGWTVYRGCDEPLPRVHRSRRHVVRHHRRTVRHTTVHRDCPPDRTVTYRECPPNRTRSTKICYPRYTDRHVRRDVHRERHVRRERHVHRERQVRRTYTAPTRLHYGGYSRTHVRHAPLAHPQGRLYVRPEPRVHPQRRTYSAPRGRHYSAPHRCYQRPHAGIRIHIDD